LDWQKSFIGSDVSSVIKKSMIDPESLTLAEKLRLHRLYLGIICLFESDFEVFAYTSESVVEQEIETTISYLSGVFCDPYAKAWIRTIGRFRLVGRT
jgi:hypothetical protein